ncbi:SDR family NAD(P)-dependent oxidoreductase [Agrobacterium pusense]|uniref:SDR family NAD(P)-dependent oxidoreductase n=1 Tax=Agrobacterium pusense TaxID=648995 RepID=UPI003FD17AEF
MSFTFGKQRGPLPIRDNRALPTHEGKKFLIVGAAGGIGAALSELLIAQGASIFVADLGEDRIEILTRRLSCNGGVIDVLDETSISATVNSAVAALGPLDGLVNCVGIAEHFPALDTSRKQWRRTFEVNVVGVYDACRMVAQHLIETGRKGAIVNIASEAGKKGHSETMLAYSASKAAVINMTRMLAEALASYDINVNCVCPGSVSTPMLEGVAEEFSEMTGQDKNSIFESMISSQLRRHVHPGEVAAVISFLLSDAATATRGQAINVDGGDTPY